MPGPEPVTESAWPCGVPSSELLAAASATRRDYLTPILWGPTGRQGRQWIWTGGLSASGHTEGGRKDLGVYMSRRAGTRGCKGTPCSMEGPCV